jgi:predicted TIM-barrel enzyme
VEDLHARGLADAVIVTGPATGRAAAEADLEAARRPCPDLPLLVGSGMTRANLPSFFGCADGFIVGTALQERGGVDSRRVRAFMRQVRALRSR